MLLSSQKKLDFYIIVTASCFFNLSQSHNISIMRTKVKSCLIQAMQYPGELQSPEMPYLSTFIHKKIIYKLKKAISV